MKNNDRKFLSVFGVVQKFLLKYFYSLIVLGVLLLSYLLRSPYVFSERMWPDEALYSWYALKIFHNPANLVSSEVLHFHPPLFAFILSLGHFLFSPKFACQLTSFIMGVVGIGGIYILGKRMRSKFVGVIAAILLAVNPIYLRYSTKVLMDAPQMLLFIFAALALLKTTEKKTTRSDIVVGLIGMCIVFLKWSGIVIIPIIVCYYLFSSKSNFVFAQIKKLLVPVSMTFGAIVIYWLLLGKIFHYGTSLVSAHAQFSKLYYFIYFPQMIHIWILIPFIFVGIYEFLKNDRKAAALIFSWLIVVVFSLSIVAQKTMRFSILFLPPIFILIGGGLEMLVHRFVKLSEQIALVKKLIVLCFCFIFVLSFSSLENDLREDNMFYKGFGEAGTWVKNNMQSETLIVASSLRNIQYYSELHIRNSEGSIKKYSKNKEKFEKLIADKDGHIILEIDNWGDTKNTIIDPFTLSQVDYLQSLGFQLVKTVSKMRYRDKMGGTMVAPAIWLFERGGVAP